MDKKKGNKKIIIMVIIVAILILAILSYFLFFKPSMFNFLGFDFSESSKIYDLFGKSGNAFDDVKLNPFTNSSG